MTARIREFNLFLRDHVNLNQSRLDTLHSRVSSLDTTLEESTILEDKLEGSLIPQGSFAHRTIIKPLSGNDFDADVLLPMTEQDVCIEEVHPRTEEGARRGAPIRREDGARETVRDYRLRQRLPHRCRTIHRTRRRPDLHHPSHAQ